MKYNDWILQKSFGCAIMKPIQGQVLPVQSKTVSERESIMKKLISVLACLLCLSMIFLTACGGRNTSGSGNPDNLSSGAGQTQQQSTAPSVPVVLEPADLIIVGDSTACAFEDDYFYPRYGFGTQISQYMDHHLTVHNLAVPGKSARSFVVEPNWRTMVETLGPGDYLLIAFGHYDEDSEDAFGFTDPSKDHTDRTSFAFHLYEYYVKIALSKGATPILCTPIVRASADNDYTGTDGHITEKGDYRQAILDLAAAMHVPVVDLTAITAERYTQLGYEKAIAYHAVVAGQYASDGVTIIADLATADKTCLNIYGAKYVAFVLANALEKIDGIGDYVLRGMAEPTIEDLIPNPNYTISN